MTTDEMKAVIEEINAALLPFMDKVHLAVVIVSHDDSRVGATFTAPPELLAPFLVEVAERMGGTGGKPRADRYVTVMQVTEGEID